MPNYDILFHTEAGHPHFLDGGIIILKPFQSHWTDEELSLGTRAVLNINPNEIENVQRELNLYRVNNKANPSSHVRNS